MNTVYIVLFTDWNDETEIVRVFNSSRCAVRSLKLFKRLQSYQYDRLLVVEYDVY